MSSHNNKKTTENDMKHTIGVDTLAYLKQTGVEAPGDVNKSY